MEDLPEFDAEAVFETQVLPALGVKAGGADAPIWVAIGGQQGSGKTTARARLMTELGEGRTQTIAGDDFAPFLPDPVQLPPDEDERRKLLNRLRMFWTEKLIDRACRMQAHVLWEQPSPAFVIEFGAIARMLGYRTQCQVLAVPLLESWLATVRRDLARLDAPDPLQAHVSWAFAEEAYHRWPAFLAQAEDRVAFDRISVLDRDGAMYFDTQSRLVGARRAWDGPGFAFESLVVERNKPRSPAAVAARAAEWDALLADPRLASASRRGWEQDSLQSCADALAALKSDPSAGFDLNQPDPALAPGWLARLRADLDATLASRDARDQKGLPDRCDRLMALVSQVAGQPFR